MTESEQAREAIALQICDMCIVSSWGCENRTGVRDGEFIKIDPLCEHCLRVVDSILSLKGDGWHLAIIQEGAELPKDECNHPEKPKPCFLGDCPNIGYCMGWGECAEAMLAAGWRKVIE